jgi:hypothetical protein
VTPERSFISTASHQRQLGRRWSASLPFAPRHPVRGTRRQADADQYLYTLRCLRRIPVGSRPANSGGAICSRARRTGWGESEEVRSTCRRSRVMGAWPPTGRRTCLTIVFCSAKSGLAADMGSATNPKPGDFVQPIPSHPFAKGRVGCAADDSGAARFVNHRVWGAQSASRRYCTFSGGTLGLDPLYRLHL